MGVFILKLACWKTVNVVFYQLMLYRSFGILAMTVHSPSAYTIVVRMYAQENRTRSQRVILPCVVWI